MVSISSYAFACCSGLEEVIIPKSVQIIEDYAFYKCAKLRHVNSLSSVIEIHRYAFGECESLEDVNISNVKSIGRASFIHCHAIKSVIIPEGITTILDLTFANCENLINVLIPGTVESICDVAFASCSSLEEIDLPTLKTFGKNVFWGCPNLKTIKVPESSANLLKKEGLTNLLKVDFSN